MFRFDENTFKNMLKFYNRTEENFQDDVNVIRSWISAQPHLPETMDDDRIKNFLLLNKCSIEKTKQKIENYYCIRHLIPELHLGLRDPVVAKTSEILYWVALPKLTKDMCRVHIAKLRRVDLVDELEPSGVFSRITQKHELRLKKDHMFKDVYIIDMEGMSWRYLSKYTPAFMMKVLAVLEKVYSNRMQAVYNINSHPLIGNIISFLKKLMKQKLFERIHFCEGKEILFDVFPKEILPKDYGGDEISLEELNVLQNKELDGLKSRFEDLNRLKIDEKLRPEKLENDEVLGFYGNFKKLNVD